MSKEGREKWAGYVESGKDVNGNKISEYKVGSGGYVHDAKTSYGDGHTTGHAGGDLHHHGDQAVSGQASHYTRSDDKPSGSILDSFFKK